MKIKIDELKKILTTAAAKYVDPQEAEYFARLGIDNYIKKQPRTGHLTDLISDIKAWKNHGDKSLEIEVDKPSTLLLNFNSLGPSLKLKYIHDEAIKRAKKNGISLIGLNHGGVHTLNLWTDALGQRDMISIFMYNGGPTSVVPFGGTQGIFGTNPISYAVPTSTEPIIVDMATSEIPFFEIKETKLNNSKLRQGVAVDNSGKITTDPNKALNSDSTISNILPLGGGYKGYAIVLLIEILTGSLVRSLLSTEMTSGYVVEEHGGLLITIDVSSLVNLSNFKQSVSTMCEQVKKQTPVQGLEQITIPGDRAYQRRDKTLLTGEVEVEQKVLDELKDLVSK